jgi:Domain of unknown function (DUF4157)
MGVTASGDHAPDPERVEDDVAAPFRAAWDFAALPIFSPEPPRGLVAPARILQPKLEIGAVDDPLEREADTVADRVMRMVDSAPPISDSPPRIRRKCAACEEEEEKKVQMKPAGTARSVGAAPPIVQEVLREPGRPLDAPTRAFFEPRFNRDLSSVRVHTNGRATQSAKNIDAHAYASDRDIVFGAGRYSPATQEGKRLLAHELTHVIQQWGGATPDLQRQPAAAGVAHAPPSLPAGIEDLNAKQFDGIFRLDRISVVEFRTDCCQPCEELVQWLSGTAKTYQGVTHPFSVKFYSLNANPMVVNKDTGHCDAELETPEGEEARAFGKRLGLASSFPQVRIYLERKLAREFNNGPNIEQVEQGLKEVIEDASMSGAEAGFHLGMGKSAAGWILPILLLPVAAVGALAGWLFGKDKGTKELSGERLQAVMEFSAGKIKGKDIVADDINHGLAVDIVNYWVDNRKTYQLNIDQRRMLIKTLMKGFTGDDEERAILKIIENSSDLEILQIFAVRDDDAPKLLELEAEFQGEEREYLDKLLANLRERFPTQPPLQETKGLLINDSMVKATLAEAFKKTNQVEPRTTEEQLECVGVFIARKGGGPLEKEVGPCEKGTSAGLNQLAIDVLKKRGKGYEIVGSFHTHPRPLTDQGNTYREAPSADDIRLFERYQGLEGPEHYVVGPLVTFAFLRDGRLLQFPTADVLGVERFPPKPGQTSTLETTFPRRK